MLKYMLDTNIVIYVVISWVLSMLGQPIMNFFNIPGTIRASFAFYNTKEEIDIFVEAVKRAQKMLS